MSNPQPFPHSIIQSVFNGKTRWQIMHALSEGGDFTINELSKRVQATPNAISKQMRQLNQLGICQQLRDHLYTLNPKHIRNPRPGVLDFGKVQIHFERKAFEPLPPLETTE